MLAQHLKLMASQRQLAEHKPIEELVTALEERGYIVHVACRLREGIWEPVFERNTGAYGSYFLAYELRVEDPVTFYDQLKVREVADEYGYTLSLK